MRFKEHMACKSHDRPGLLTDVVVSAAMEVVFAAGRVFRFPFRPEIQSCQMFPDFKHPFRHVVHPRFGPRHRQTLATSCVAARGHAVLPPSAGNTSVVFDSLSRPTALGSNLAFPAGTAAGRARPHENGACLPSARR